MTSGARCWGVAAVAAVVVALSPAHAFAQAVRVEAVEGPPEWAPEGVERSRQRLQPAFMDTLVGLDAAGAEVWRTLVTDHRDVVGPIVVKGHTVYALMNDLVEVDPATGHVVARDRFPGPIQSIVPVAGDEPIVTVTIGVEEFFRANDAATLELRHHLGDPGPGKAYLGGMFGWFWVSQIPDELKAPEGPYDKYPPDRARAERAIVALEPLLAMDPTDVRRRLSYGTWLAILGRDAEAAAAYRDAADRPGAPWPDLLHLSGRLEERGAAEAAGIAYEHGKAGMLRAGVRPEAMQALVTWMILGEGRKGGAIRAAVAAGDVARVDQLASRTWAVAPHLEGADWGWTVLARWFDEHGRPDLAAVWRARAEKASGGWLNRVRQRSESTVRHFAPLIDGMLLASLAGALLVGIRAAGRRRARGGRRWMPSLRWHDALLVGTPLLACAMLVPRLAGSLDLTMVAFGSPAMTDGFASPLLINDLEHAPPGAAVERVLAYARAEQRVLTEGVAHSIGPPSESDVFDAIASLPPPSSGSYLERATGFDRPWSALGWVGDAGPAAAAWLLAAFALGFAVTTRWRRAGLVVETALPGAGPTFSFGSGLLVGLFITGLLVCLGPDAMGDPDFLRYVGLDGLGYPGGPPTSREWAWLLVAAIPALQILERMRPRRAEPG